MCRVHVRVLNMCYIMRSSTRAMRRGCNIEVCAAAICCVCAFEA